MWPAIGSPMHRNGRGASGFSGRTVSDERVRLSLRAESRWQSTVFFTPFNDGIQRQSAYGLLDGSGEFGPAHRQWSVTAWARNLTNTDYITGSFSTPIPAIGGRPGAPRQAGVSNSPFDGKCPVQTLIDVSVPVLTFRCSRESDST